MINPTLEARIFGTATGLKQRVDILNGSRELVAATDKLLGELRELDDPDGVHRLMNYGEIGSMVLPPKPEPVQVPDSRFTSRHVLALLNLST